MSGHSKWSNIKHRKAAVDAKRGAIFTKLGKEIMVSARLGGGDLNANIRLKAAVTKAKSYNMPRDNIEKAIKKGTGELEGLSYEEAVYEAYAPGGAALIIEVLTDKKSRTIPELKNILTKNGGSMAESGAVSYLFDLIGIIIIEGDNISEDKIMEIVLDSGALDYEKDADHFIIKTRKEDFHSAMQFITPVAESLNWKINLSEIRYVPHLMLDLDEESHARVMKLIEILEDNDDVQNVYSNIH